MERLRAKLPPQFMATRVLKIAMMAESQCDARVAPIYKRYTDVQTTILAGAGRNPVASEDPRGIARGGATARRPAGGRNRRRTRRQRFFPTTEIRSSRSSAITCRCATPRWRWPSPAPADCWRSASLRSAAARVTSWAERWFTPTSLKTAFADVPAKLIEKHGAVSARSRGRAGRGHSQALRLDAGNRHYRRGRPGGRHAGKTGGPRLSSLWPVKKGPRSRREIFPAIASASAGSPASWRWT